MDFLFGHRKTPEEMLRQNQRALNKAMRDLDRERQRLEQQEKKVIADIKKMANLNQMDAVKIMAKDLVRTRNYIKKFILMRANIQAVSLKAETLRSTNAMAQAMKGVAQTMSRMNARMNIPAMQQIMMEFEKQSEVMDMKEEMMGEAVDDALGEEGDEQESDQIVHQVLDELGIELKEKLGEVPADSLGANKAPAAKKAEPLAPGGAPSGAAGNATGPANPDDDLEARLNALKRS